jgi:ABC-type multidrug transport system ATPase subunit
MSSADLTASNVNGTPALRVEGLGKRFGDRLAFEDVSFEIGYGEVFGFLGPNGAGKTTTVRTLGTLIAPTSGSATVAGSRSRRRTASRSVGGSRSCPSRRVCICG